MGNDVELTVKPVLRGVFHLFAAFSSLGAGLVLVAMSPTLRVGFSAGVFAVALTWLLAVSALYHWPTWKPNVRRWLRRLDHASIFLLIAGTYTPICLLALPPESGRSLLWMMWIGALLGMLKSGLWAHAPKIVSAVVYVSFGWLAVGFLPTIFHAVSGLCFGLLVLGGVIYSLGALAYALRRPNPLPGILGYHEVFHVLVILASLCHFIVVLLLVRES